MLSWKKFMVTEHQPESTALTSICNNKSSKHINVCQALCSWTFIHSNSFSHYKQQMK